MVFSAKCGPNEARQSEVVENFVRSQVPSPGLEAGVTALPALHIQETGSQQILQLPHQHNDVTRVR